MTNHNILVTTKFLHKSRKPLLKVFRSAFYSTLYFINTKIRYLERSLTLLLYTTLDSVGIWLTFAGTLPRIIACLVCISKPGIILCDTYILVPFNDSNRSDSSLILLSSSF